MDNADEQPITPMTGEQAMNAVEAMKAQMGKVIKPPTPEEMVAKLESALRFYEFGEPDYEEDARQEWQKVRSRVISRLASMEAMRAALRAALPFVEDAENDVENNDDEGFREMAAHETVKLIRAALSGKAGEA